MPLIALGGFHHETNTFAPSRASYEDFVMADGWPGLTRGRDILEVFQRRNIGTSGFLEVGRERGWDFAPTVWCAAQPCAHVRSDAYERVAGEIVAGIRAAGKVDAVYLCMHGAMVTEQHEDGEGELLRRVRGVVGPDVPVVASLDFHANVTAAMVEHADGLCVYRTYPHLDMAETGRRAARLLAAMMERGTRPAKAFRRMPFLIPISQQCTFIDPAKSLWDSLPGFESQGGVAEISLLAGFPPADIAECGPSLVAYGWDKDRVEASAEALERAVLAAEPSFASKLWPAGEAVAYAKRLSNSATRPVILADTQDNPGAGADSDTVGVIEELVKQDAQGAVVGMLYDPATAAAAHKAGRGSTVERGIGAISGQPGHAPFRGRFVVEALSDGVFEATGIMFSGARMELGPCAVLRIGGVRIVVVSRRMQPADQAMFTHLGIAPGESKILVLKSSVHFRGDFQPLAEEILVVAAPGPNIDDPTKLPYRRLRPGVRLRPLGPVSGG
jgi:microcystin degradation protein MlrC